MSRRRSPGRTPPRGPAKASVGQRDPITKQQSEWREIDPVNGVVPGPNGAVMVTAHRFVRRVGDGILQVILAEEPPGWHLSISFTNPKGEPSRYPRWDEIAAARDRFLPADVGFVMHLPKAAGYVAHHASTFHLHEHPEREAPHAEP